MRHFQIYCFTIFTVFFWLFASTVRKYIPLVKEEISKIPLVAERFCCTTVLPNTSVIVAFSIVVLFFEAIVIMPLVGFG